MVDRNCKHEFLFECKAIDVKVEITKTPESQSRWPLSTKSLSRHLAGVLSLFSAIRRGIVRFNEVLSNRVLVALVAFLFFGPAATGSGSLNMVVARTALAAPATCFRTCHCKGFGTYRANDGRYVIPP